MTTIKETHNTAMLIKKTIITAFAFISIMSFSACSKNEPSKPLVQPGQMAPSSVTVENKIKHLKGVLEKDPKDLASLIELGNAMMDSRRFSEAIEYYERAIKIDAKNVDVMVDIGTCYRYVGQPQKAVEIYKKAIIVNPAHLNVHKNLAIVYADDLKDMDSSVKEFETYLKLQSKSSVMDPDIAKIQQIIADYKARKKK